MSTTKKTESAVKRTIRRNVCALIGHREGILATQVGVSKIMKLGVANGTAQRLLSSEQDISLEVLQTLADGLSVSPWQLLVPDFEPAALPTLTGETKPWSFPLVDEQRYLALPREARTFVQGKLDAAIEEQERRSMDREPRIANGL